MKNGERCWIVQGNDVQEVEYIRAATRAADKDHPASSVVRNIDDSTIFEAGDDDVYADRKEAAERAIAQGEAVIERCRREAAEAQRRVDALRASLT
ncbi:MAG: hypothetical protein QOI11_421 [Candidatus Eremiobacteraeota bacterium]|jgi:acylphosphatase|nr:hypothetical protein [Candidatus Eremiobacteraeota bacterium]